MSERKKRPVALIILDGWGYREEKEHNAIAVAQTPYFDHLWNTYHPTLLEASGESVGLPNGQMGNSEVGHGTIGAGTIIYTDLVRISQAAKNDEFKNNLAFQQLFDHVKKNDSVLHIKGLIGPGGIHSHSDHLYAFLKLAKENGIEKIAIHAFTDGRDTPPQSAAKYLKELESILESLKIGLIASVSGRFYAMDRDNNWDRLAKAESAIFDCQGKICHAKNKPSEIVNNLYLNGIVDEHIEPIVFLDDNGRGYPVSKNDGVFFFNYRADRARMLSKKIVEKAKTDNLFFVTMTEYDSKLDCIVAFPPLRVKTTLAAEISRAGLSQVHVAETEKFAHVTYFLNGGQQEKFAHEDHILIDSRKDIATHDLAPEMMAKEVADKTIESLENNVDLLIVNFANPDMVGHTANVPALIKAIETVDFQLKRVVEKVLEKGGVAFITADHGNAELNVDSTTGAKHTAHTTNLVPAILTDNNYHLHKGGLADIAPTILELFEISKPASMTGKSLLEKI